MPPVKARPGTILISGKKFAALRGYRGQDEFGKAIGMKVRNVNRIERQDVVGIFANKIPLLAKYLGMSEQEVVERLTPEPVEPAEEHSVASILDRVKDSTVVVNLSASGAGKSSLFQSILDTGTPMVAVPGNHNHWGTYSLSSPEWVDHYTAHSHGTHVVGIIAGSADPLPGFPTRQQKQRLMAIAAKMRRTPDQFLNAVLSMLEQAQGQQAESVREQELDQPPEPNPATAAIALAHQARGAVEFLRGQHMTLQQIAALAGMARETLSIMMKSRDPMETYEPNVREGFERIIHLARSKLFDAGATAGEGPKSMPRERVPGVDWQVRRDIGIAESPPAPAPEQSPEEETRARAPKAKPR